MSAVSFANAQTKTLLPKNNHEKNYFRWPIDAQIGIAANFGELRPNHYHMGLDCRSDQAENKDILAAADGYIAKVKVEPWGFGQALYVAHPNGMTTLYAHLNSFYPLLEEYVEAKQYEMKSWEVYLDIPAGMFPVKQGDMIAKSGNTGGSQGPHLHFEIRDTKTDKVLNPLLMGFPLRDMTPPDILRVAVYDRRLSTYEQRPKIFTAVRQGLKYTVAGGLMTINTEKVSFAITAWDKYTGSTNQNGIFQAEQFVDSVPVSGFQLNNIGYDETRYLNANIDYTTRANGGPWLQHLSKLAGYNTGVYVTDASNGVVDLEKGKKKKITIKVGDTNGNTSILEFDVVMNTIIENPRQVDPDISKSFHPGFINVFDDDKVKFYLPEGAIYDSFNLRYKEITSTIGTPIYQIHTATVPLQQYVQFNIRSNFPLADSGKIVMKRSHGSKIDYLKANYNDGWYGAKFREFGNFQLLKDTMPPVVTPIGFLDGMNASKLSSITFTVKEDSEDLRSFNGYLDGEWIKFSYDKTRYYRYKFDERCIPGNHTLKIVAVDLVGNVTEKNYTFTR